MSSYVHHIFIFIFIQYLSGSVKQERDAQVRNAIQKGSTAHFETTTLFYSSKKTSFDFVSLFILHKIMYDVVSLDTFCITKS